MTAPFAPKLPRVGVTRLREIVEVDGKGRLVTMRAIVGVEQIGERRTATDPDGAVRGSMLQAQ